jgi:uncharacterized membrane-anchored protein
VGETAADHLGGNLGLTYATFLLTDLLVLALAVQFAVRRYVPVVYWVAVVLISVVGTLVTDDLTDTLGVPLAISTAVFTVLLAGTFAVWFAAERTLSIHTIVTPRREGFYWLAILCTFALGTAAGGLVAEQWSLGYVATGLLFGAAIAVVAVGWRLGLNPVVAFWIAYVLSRPLGASIGDLASQPRSHGGLGLGTTDTSLLFLVAISLLVAFLSVTKRDVTEVNEPS